MQGAAPGLDDGRGIEHPLALLPGGDVVLCDGPNRLVEELRQQVLLDVPKVICPADGSCHLPPRTFASSSSAACSAARLVRKRRSSLFTTSDIPLIHELTAITVDQALGSPKIPCYGVLDERPICTLKYSSEQPRITPPPERGVHGPGH
jgi:hypothetical protein